MRFTSISNQDRIYTLTKIDASLEKNTAYIFIGESLKTNFNRYFEDNDFLFNKFSAVYILPRVKLQGKLYTTNVSELETTFEDKFSVNLKSMLHLTGTKTPIVDLTNIAQILNKLSISQQEKNLQSSIETIIDFLKRKDFTNIKLFYIIDSSLKKTFPRRFINFLSNLPIKDIEIIAKQEEKLKILKITNSESSIKKNKSLFLTMTKYKTEVLKDEKLKSFDKYIDSVSIAEKEIIERGINKDVIDAAELRNYKPTEAIARISTVALSDSNSSKQLKTFDETKFEKLMTKRLEKGSTILKDGIEKNTKVEKLNKVATKVEAFLPDTSKVNDINKSYNKNIKQVDIQNVFNTFEDDPDYPMILTDVKVEDSSTDTTLKETYVARYLNKDGKIVKLTVDLPKLADDGKTYFIDGTKYFMVNQLVTKPITKVAADRAALTTNFNKTFVYRFNNTGKYSKISKVNDILKKTQNILSKDNISLNEYFDSETDSLFEALERAEISKDFYFSRNFEDIFNLVSKAGSRKKIDEYKLKYCGRNGNEYLFIDKIGIVHEVTNLKDIDENAISTNKTLINYIIDETNMKPIIKTYARMNVIGKKIPLILFLMSSFSVKEIFKAANIKFSLVESKVRMAQSQTRRILNLSDSKVIVEVDTMSKELLFNYLNLMSINGKLKNISTKEFFSKNNHTVLRNDLEPQIIENLGYYARDIIDPITKNILEKDLLPTDILNIMIYITDLISNNRYKQNNDFNNFRVRNEETIPAMLYKTIAQNHSAFVKTYKRSRFRDQLKPSIPKEKIIKEFVTVLPNVSTYSSGNATQELEEAHKVSYSGFLGINSQDSISFDMRKPHESHKGIVDISSLIDNSSSGATKFLSVGTKLNDVRGMIDVKKEEVEATLKNNPGNLVGVTNNIEPFNIYADPMRTSLTKSQAMHLFPSPSSISKPLVRTGSEEVLKGFMGENFIRKATSSGVVTEVNDNFITVKDSKGKLTNYKIGTITRRNGGAGFTLSHEFVVKNNIKVGSKVKKDDILAESSAIFKDGVLSNQGKLTLVTLTPDVRLLEDAGLMSEGYAKSISLPYVKEQMIDVLNIHKLLSFKKIGDEVHAEENLITYEENVEEIASKNTSMDNYDFGDLFDDQSVFGVTSNVTGKIINMTVIYNKKDEDLTEVEKKLISYMKSKDKQNSNIMEKNLRKDKPGFILGRRIQDVVTIVYEIEKSLKHQSGNKITLQMTKAVVQVVPDDEMLVSDTYGTIDVRISSFSFITRFSIISATMAIFSNTIMKVSQDRLPKMEIKKARLYVYELVKVFAENEEKNFATKYLNTFKKMTDAEFKNFINKDFHIIVRVFKEPSINSMKSFAKDHDIVLEEKLKVFDKDIGKYVYMKEPSIVGYAMIKSLVQTANKNTISSFDVDNTNLDTGTITNTSKVAQFGLTESINSFALGIEESLLPEINSIRGDNSEARTDMINQIITNGEYDPDTISSKGSGQVSNLVSVYLESAGYDTTIVPKTTVTVGNRSMDVR